MCSDRLIKFWIVGTLLEEVLIHAIKLQTIAKAWKALTDHFMQSPVTLELDLLGQIQRIRKENKPLLFNLHELKSICD